MSYSRAAKLRILNFAFAKARARRTLTRFYVPRDSAANEHFRDKLLASCQKPFSSPENP